MNGKCCDLGPLPHQARYESHLRKTGHHFDAALHHLLHREHVARPRSRALDAGVHGMAGDALSWAGRDGDRSRGLPEGWPADEVTH